MTDFDDDDLYDDLGEDDEDYNCGAYGPAKTDVKAWQMCSMAGTEYCDFECRFARSVRDGLRDERSNAN